MQPHRRRPRRLSAGWLADALQPEANPVADCVRRGDRWVRTVPHRIRAPVCAPETAQAIAIAFPEFFGSSLVTSTLAEARGYGNARSRRLAADNGRQPMRIPQEEDMPDEKLDLLKGTLDLLACHSSFVNTIGEVSR